MRPHTPDAVVAAEWQFTDVRLACRGLVPQSAQPLLLSRLRGQLGRYLHGLVPATLYDAMFPQSGQVPPPFVVRIDGPANDPVLVVRLFGHAATLSGAVAVALESLAGDGLIVPGRTQPLVGDGIIEIHRRCCAPAKQAADTVTLHFSTPLCLDPAASFQVGPFLNGMTRRLTLLAQWQDNPTLPMLPEQLVVTAVPSLVLEVWVRVAHRQGGRRVPMAGHRGDIRLHGQISTIMPLLALAEACHVGGRAAFGMGRFRMIAGDAACT